MKRIKKLLAALLVFALVLPGIYITAPQMREVQAEEANNIEKVTEQDGTIFAGYYVDEECTIPSDIEGGTEKWVDSGVLNVKMQLRQNADNAENYDLRLVSTVDTLNYKNVGFKISFDADNSKTFEISEIVTWTTKEVASRVNASTSTFTYNYSPKVIDTDSEYFITGILQGIKGEHADKDFLIEPFWTTLDGTVVYGQNRWFSISDITNANINIPVKMTQAAYDNIAVGNTITVDATNTTVTEKYFDGRYAHFNLSIADKTALPSASVVTIGDEKIVYRNLETKGTTGDATWYSAYTMVNPDETEFVIATTPDMYGLETVQKNNSGLKGNTVYLVADIELNDVSKVDDWSSLTVSQAAQAGFTNWTPIGRTNGFQGKFDGQMHTIRGLFINGTNGYGLFGSLYKAEVKNLYLKDSWVRGTFKVGGVVGVATDSTIDTVYNQAYVTTETATVASTLGSNAGIGGVVGVVAGTTVVNNCWNAGTVYSNQAKWAMAGGIVGMTTGTVSITNCLNTGKIDTTTATVGSQYSGGIIGGSYVADGQCDMKYCLSAGEVALPSLSSMNCYGPFYGGFANSATVTIRNNYGTTNAKGNLETSALYGADGWGSTLLNDDYWVAVDGGIPELKSFRILSDKTVSDVSSIQRVDTGWYKTTDTTFTLYTEEEFAGLIQLSNNATYAGFQGKKINLGADLVFNEGDATKWAQTAPGRTYAPIGNGASFIFKGTIDGNNHTISGLYIKKTSGNWCGLIALAGSNACVQNLKIVNSYFELAGQQVGSIVGQVNSATVTIKSVYSDAIVKGADMYVGGIVGVAANGCEISDCWFAGTVEGAKAGLAYIGGIIGGVTANGVTVTNCLNTGIINKTSTTGNNIIGGIVGGAYHSSSLDLSIQDCLGAGTLKTATSATVNMGSIIGYSKDATTTVTNSYGTVESCSTATTYLSATATKTGQLSEAQLSAAGGYAWTNLNTDNWVAVKGGTPQLKSFQTKVAAELPDSRVDTSWYDQGTTSGVTYTLSDAGDFFGFNQLAQTIDFSGQTVTFASNVTEIDLKDVLCSPMGTPSVPFAGTFDGNNVIIKGLYIKAEQQFAGMFGALSGEVKNFKLEDSYIESAFDGDPYLGSIAGRLIGKLTNVSSNATVVSNGSFAGGLVGQTFNTYTPTLSQCTFSGELIMSSSSAKNAGGFIGLVQGASKIEHCLFSGNITSNLTNGNAYTGGVAGRVNAALDITDTLCSGNIKFVNAASDIARAGSVVGWVNDDNANNLLKISGAMQVTKDCYHDKDHNALYYDSATQTVDGASLITVFEDSSYGTVGTLNSAYWQAVPGGTPILKNQ